MKILFQQTLIGLVSFGISAAAVQAGVLAVKVFEAGEAGYKVFRIPAIVTAANGDLLAFCEARQGGDASEIDLVLKRSSDGGKTWGKVDIVQESDDFLSLYPEEKAADITIGNPAPVVDQLDPDHPGRLWLPFTLENDRVFVVYSDDSGKTWSKRREITKDVKKEPWGWYATGPVHSIQVQKGPHRGRLVIPCDHRLSDDGEDKGPNGAHAILSDDHGKTWRIGALDETYEDGLNANETTVVELNDGTLYFNTRDQNGEAPGTRGEAWSTDGGETLESRSGDWEKFRPTSKVLDPPVVQAALLRARADLILFSGPDNNGPTGEGRSDMRIRYSTDDAKSWQDGPLVHAGPAAYSDMVMVNEETVGVMFEGGERGRYEAIRFATLKLDEIEGGDLAVYKAGGGYGYRIPALVTAKNGDLLAFCERRFGFSDHAKNDIVLKRSSDHGKTWTEMEIVHDAGGDSLNDPSAIVLEDGEIILMYQQFPEGYHTITRHSMTMAERGFGGPRNTRTLMRRSTDHGKSWSEAVDVTKAVRRPEAVNIASPGRGIQLTRGEHAGRLLYPVYENHSNTKDRIWNTSVLISDDEGKTWRAGEMVPPDDLGGYGNENQIVELKDGSVLMSSRNQAGGKLRRLTVSRDGGETWEPYRLAEDLVTPQCMASVIRKGDLLVHSLPNSSARRDGAILVSRDEGKNWERVHTITPGGFAYSSLTEMADGRVACLYEADGYKSIRLAIVPEAVLGGVTSIDLDGDSERQVIVDREKGQYLGHPTTCLLDDGKTMLCVYPKGHGKGAIVYKRSEDGGLSWSERLPTPDSWSTSQEVPTLHRVTDTSGKKRIIMWSGLYPARLAVTEDDGASWSELKPAGDWGGVVTMGSVIELKTGPGHYMSFFHDDGRFFKANGKRETPKKRVTLYTTTSKDGGLRWSYPKAIHDSKAIHLCEPGALRSPDGKQIAVLLRENARVKNSYIIFSDDEGETWSEPRQVPDSLNGDRHTAKYGPDGRLFISFRSRSPKGKKAVYEGDWVAWVGSYEDLVEGRSGQYHVRLKDNHHGWDCAYPGVEVLPDGTVVTTTYGHWKKGEKPYVISVRLKLEELDTLALSER